MLTRCSFLSIALVLVACSPTLDGSSDESFEASLERVRQAIPEARRAAFDTAMITVGLSDFDLLGGVFTEAASPGQLSRTIRERIDGRTAADVFAMSDSIVAEMEARAREAALEEIEELELKKLASEVAAVELAKFEVVRARFYQEEGIFGSEPKIELTLRNGTASAVSRAYFRGKVVSEGRSVSWIDEEFNFSLPGGIEPGETGDWTVSPNRFDGGWGRETPGDAVFIATVVRLDGPDGATLFGMDFNDLDQERLDALMSEWR